MMSEDVKALLTRGQARSPGDTATARLGTALGTALVRPGPGLGGTLGRVAVTGVGLSARRCCRGVFSSLSPPPRLPLGARLLTAELLLPARLELFVVVGTWGSARLAARTNGACNGLICWAPGEIDGLCVLPVVNQPQPTTHASTADNGNGFSALSAAADPRRHVVPLSAQLWMVRAGCRRPHVGSLRQARILPSPHSSCSQAGSGHVASPGCGCTSHHRVSPPRWAAGLQDRCQAAALGPAGAPSSAVPASPGLPVPQRGIVPGSAGAALRAEPRLRWRCREDARLLSRCDAASAVAAVLRVRPRCAGAGCA